MHYKERLKIIRSNLLGFDFGYLSLYYRLFFSPKVGSLQEFLEELAEDIKPFRFLQIGGNDGYANDPIFKLVKKHPWEGIIVEPQDEVFHRKLKKTYRWERKVILENIAISDKTEVKKLWKIGLSNSRWATGLASFNRATLVHQIERDYVGKSLRKEGLPVPDKIDDFLTYDEVPCISITELMTKHGFDALDLLQIDTEGYDFEIIRTIDFTKLKPRIVSFENEHLSEPDYESCKALLADNGYSIRQLGRDTVAWL